MDGRRMDGYGTPVTHPQPLSRGEGRAGSRPAGDGRLGRWAEALNFLLSGRDYIFYGKGLGFIFYLYLRGIRP